MLQVLAHFAVLEDPRAANARHELSEIMFIAIAATLAGAKTCVEMAEFGEAKETLLRKVLAERQAHRFGLVVLAPRFEAPGVGISASLLRWLLAPRRGQTWRALQGFRPR